QVDLRGALRRIVTSGSRNSHGRLDGLGRPRTAGRRVHGRTSSSRLACAIQPTRPTRCQGKEIFLSPGDTLEGPLAGAEREGTGFGRLTGRRAGSTLAARETPLWSWPGDLGGLPPGGGQKT